MICRYYFYLHRAPHTVTWVTTICRLDSFAVGIWIGMNSDSLSQFISKKKYNQNFSIRNRSYLVHFSFPNINQGSPHLVWTYLAFAIALGSLLLVATGKNLFSKFLSLAPLVFLGKISYGLYVFHNIGIGIQYLWIQFLHNQYPGTTPIVTSWPIKFATSLLFTIILATISYFLYEKHFLKLKERFTTIASRPV